MDYRQRPAPTTDTETYDYRMNWAARKTASCPLAPCTSLLDEPGHFRLFVDGENVVDADYRMFYVHRGMEKLRKYAWATMKSPFWPSRVCGICGYAHSIAYANSVEKRPDINVPMRARWIRTLLLEAERLHSHLLNLGLVCHFYGL